MDTDIFAKFELVKQIGQCSGNYASQLPSFGARHREGLSWTGLAVGKDGSIVPVKGPTINFLNKDFEM